MNYPNKLRFLPKETLIKHNERNLTKFYIFYPQQRISSHKNFGIYAHHLQ